MSKIEGRVLCSALLLCLAVIGASQAEAQNGYDPYAYPYGYPYGYPAQPYGYPEQPYGYQFDAYGNLVAPQGYGTGYADPYGTGMGYYGPGYGLPSYEQLMQQSQANYDAIAAQMAQLEQQINASIAEGERMFAQYYRDQTGDLSTPDKQATQLGQNLWCSNNPVECERSNQQAAAWSQQSAAAHQQRMAQNQAAFDAHQQSMADLSATQDASFNSWMANQNAMYEANQGFIQGVIYEEGNYTSPSTGQTMSLPFAPSNNWAYQSPAGNPLWFDPSSNVWYEVDPSGNYMPYYGQ